MKSSEPKPKAVGHSAQDKMLHEGLEKLGVKLEGFLFRSPRDWMPTQYAFCLTFPDGSTRTGMVEWNLDTFSVLMLKAKEGPSA